MIEVGEIWVLYSLDFTDFVVCIDYIKGKSKAMRKLLEGALDS